MLVGDINVGIIQGLIVCVERRDLDFELEILPYETKIACSSMAEVFMQIKKMAKGAADGHETEIVDTIMRLLK